MSASPSVLMVAGEASADLHGALVVAALRQAHPGLTCFGIGGGRMIAAGFIASARAEEISVMGLTEVLLRLPRIWGIARRLVAEAAARRPAAAILIDLPDFNLRLAARLRRLGVPVVYYISPQVWAWRPRRVEQIRRLVDQMLVILPFEEEFYRAHGVPARFVGHPLVEELAPGDDDQAAARVALGLPAEPGQQVVALLPGSRRAELRRHLPVLVPAAQALVAERPGLRFTLPVASADLRPLVAAATAPLGAALTIVEGDATRAVAASDVAAVCSGTATLQTALLGRPLVVFYRLSWLSFQILRRLVKVSAIALVNLIAGRPLVPELVQGDFTPRRLAAELGALLDDHERRRGLADELLALRAQLGSRRASLEVAAAVGRYLSPGRSSNDPGAGPRVEPDAPTQGQEEQRPWVT